MGQILITLKKNSIELLDGHHGIEGALIIRDGFNIFRVSAPGAIDHILIFVGTGREFDGGRIDTILRLIGHGFCGRVPVIELTGHIDGLALFGMEREGHRLFGVGDFSDFLRGGLDDRLLRCNDLFGRAFAGVFDLHFCPFIRPNLGRISPFIGEQPYSISYFRKNFNTQNAKKCTFFQFEGVLGVIFWENFTFCMRFFPTRGKNMV